VKVVYEPKGKAKEYADLACNTYVSCPHSCTYCYAKNVMHKSAEEFHKCAIARMAVKAYIEDDFREMAANVDKRRVHFNFISDPYPELESKLHLTRFCLEKAAAYNIGCNILTKGRYNTIRPDFDLFKEAGVHFGVSLSICSLSTRIVWEPKAAPIQERMRLLTEAHNMGIFTWVSMEPVIHPDEALKVLDAMHPWVDLWKVGKLNYHPHAKTVDWAKFREDFIKAADRVGAKYIIKKSLLEA